MRDSSHKDLVLPEFVWFLSLNVLNIVIDWGCATQCQKHGLKAVT